MTNQLKQCCTVTFYTRTHIKSITVVPAMYSPQQPPRMCGNVSIYGYFPSEIPCKKLPAEHLFHVIFPTLNIQFEWPSTPKIFTVSFGFTILSEMLVSEISKVMHDGRIYFFPLFFTKSQEIWNESSKANLWSLDTLWEWNHPCFL